jgi:hypothetical protein
MKFHNAGTITPANMEVQWNVLKTTNATTVPIIP